MVPSSSRCCAVGSMKGKKIEERRERGEKKKMIEIKI